MAIKHEAELYAPLKAFSKRTVTSLKERSAIAIWSE